VKNKELNLLKKMVHKHNAIEAFYLAFTRQRAISAIKLHDGTFFA